MSSDGNHSPVTTEQFLPRTTFRSAHEANRTPFQETVQGPPSNSRKESVSTLNANCIPSQSTASYHECKSLSLTLHLTSYGWKYLFFLIFLQEYLTRKIMAHFSVFKDYG